jgi:pilus assembly protein TadC
MNQNKAGENLNIKSPLFLSKKLISYVQATEVKPGRLPKNLKKALLFSVMLILLNFSAYLILKNRLPPEVPLYYGMAEGDLQLAPVHGLLFPSIFALSVIIINSVLALVIKNDFLKHVLVLTALGITILIVITTAKIMLLVGSF